MLCIALIALALFQLALILGAPFGRFAWGGSDRVLPAKRRVASAGAIVLYTIFAVVFILQAGPLPALLVTILAWVIVAYLAFGTVMNALSRSPQERLTMTPVSALLTVLGVVVILG
nr:hypothetical protein [Leifsonia shinshuensis]